MSLCFQQCCQPRQPGSSKEVAVPVGKMSRAVLANPRGQFNARLFLAKDSKSNEFHRYTAFPASHRLIVGSTLEIASRVASISSEVCAKLMLPCFAATGKL